MKRYMRGRHLGVVLDGSSETAAAKLEQLGFTAARAAEVAAAALKYVQEEADVLTRHLTPQSAWGGTAFIRPHNSARGEQTWLVLKFLPGGEWQLDAALFD